jgi:tetratricopeptide (TPR) repeat protein
MAKKLTREELRRDEVMETVGKGFQYVTSHRKGTGEAVAIGVGLAILVGAFAFFRSYRESQASAHLTRALDILAAPLSGEPSLDSSAKPYANAAAREADAAKELKAAASMSATRASREAAVILAARGAAGKDAISNLENFARANRDVLGAAAELSSFRLLSSEGKTREAIEKVKQAIESPRSAVAKDVLLFELGRLYEKNGSSSDAKGAYQRLVSEFPDSQFTSDAQARIGAI